jgi:hypothetical protein
MKLVKNITKEEQEWRNAVVADIKDLHANQLDLVKIFAFALTLQIFACGLILMLAFS